MFDPLLTTPFYPRFYEEDTAFRQAVASQVERHMRGHREEVIQQGTKYREEQRTLLLEQVNQTKKLRSELAQARTEIVALAIKVDNCNARNAATTAEAGDLTTELSTLKSHLSALTTKVNALDPNRIPSTSHFELTTCPCTAVYKTVSAWAAEFWDTTVVSAQNWLAQELHAVLITGENRRRFEAFAAFLREVFAVLGGFLAGL